MTGGGRPCGRTQPHARAVCRSQPSLLAQCQARKIEKIEKVHDLKLKLVYNYSHKIILLIEDSNEYNK